MARVVVVGDSGSGKTSVASELGHRFRLPHTQLDALFHGPGWRPVDVEVFRARAGRIAATDRWVMDGNYRQVRDVVWDRATSIVWLDLPLRVTIPRLVRRTWRRARTGEELWNENVEELRRVFRPDHPIWWTLRRHRQRIRAYQQLMDERWVRLRSVDDVREWMRSLTEADLCR